MILCFHIYIYIILFIPVFLLQFVAGFGKGGTSLPFWENVCDFDMSCIGEELVIDAARYPIVDVIDHQDLVTSSTILQVCALCVM